MTEERNNMTKTTPGVTVETNMNTKELIKLIEEEIGQINQISGEDENGNEIIIDEKLKTLAEVMEEALHLRDEWKKSEQRLREAVEDGKDKFVVVDSVRLNSQDINFNGHLFFMGNGSLISGCVFNEVSTKQL